MGRGRWGRKGGAQWAAVALDDERGGRHSGQGALDDIGGLFHGRRRCPAWVGTTGVSTIIKWLKTTHLDDVAPATSSFPSQIDENGSHLAPVLVLFVFGGIW
jgi:hypothetical protein